MDKEQLIKELKELRQELMEDLMRINAKHDMLVGFIADLNHIIGEAEKESDT